jgi:hypothetical protein
LRTSLSTSISVFGLNNPANRFLGDIFLYSNFSVVKLNFSPFHIIFIADPSLVNVFQIISLTLLQALTPVHRRVSATHSTAINGVRAKDVGTFRNFWYQRHSVQLLCIAFFISAPVFHIPIKGSNTRLRADFVVSMVVRQAVLTVRGAIPNVFTILFRILPI